LPAEAAAQGGDGRVVEGTGQPVGSPVESGHGVVRDEGIGAASQGQVVAEVAGRLGQVHGPQAEAGGDALVEGGEHAHAQVAAEHGLADEDAGEGAGRVHVGVGEQAQLLELGGGEQMGLAITSTTRRWRSASSAASREEAWAMASALWKRGSPPRALTMVT